MLTWRLLAKLGRESDYECELTAQIGSSETASERLNCASAVVKRDTKTKRLASIIFNPDMQV